MKRIIAAVMVMMIILPLTAQIENSEKYNRFNQREKFFVDALNFSSEDEGKTRIDVFVQVPFNEVQFIKKEERFEANYSLQVSIFTPEKNKLIMEKMWNEKISSSDFEATNSKNTFNLSMRSFDLEPGKYMVRIELTDKDSRKSFPLEAALEVRNIEDQTGVSDLMIIARQTGETHNKIVPNVSRQITSNQGGIPIFFEYYTGNPGLHKVEYAISDKDQNIVVREETDQQVKAGKNQILHTIKGSEIGMGSYILTVSIKDENNKKVASVNKSFQSRMPGLPASIKDLDKAISQLRYIASSSELKYIENATTREDKVDRYLEFWKKKDPTPNTEENQLFEEYYKRVAYANENFSHYIEGWRTDRGMVFIILGAPSNVNRHPFEYDTKPYEVWEYYELNKQFVFMDETGFGDYRLLTPLYGDFNRFR
jgi:GWxTD domain-containing protein